jgi:hypothetical protein
MRSASHSVANRPRLHSPASAEHLPCSVGISSLATGVSSQRSAVPPMTLHSYMVPPPETAMGSASYPVIVLTLWFAFFMPDPGIGDGLHLTRLSDAPVTVAAVAPQSSPLVFEDLYSLGGSRLQIRFEVDGGSTTLATLAADAEALGIRVGIQHDAAGFALSFDASGLLRSFSVQRLFSLFRISA